MSRGVSGLEVVHVVPYYPPHQGGMEVAAAKLVDVLSATGIDARVITSAFGGTPQGEDPLAVQRLRGIELGSTPVLWRLLPTLYRIAPGAVVHAHVAQAFVPDAAVLIARRRGLPTISHYHLDVDRSGPLGMLLAPYQKTILRRTLRHSDAVVVPTEDYVGIVADRYGVPGSRISVIPNGTDFPVAPSPRYPATGVWRLVSVGRLSPQKNYPLLFEACGALRDRYPDLKWKLDVYGEGSLRTELEREISRLGLRELVRLGRGDLNRTQLMERFDEADLFVLSTRKESFGLVYLEAMARGLPIVTTSAPGIRNVVHDGRNGILSRETPEGFADAMASLMCDAEKYIAISRANLVDARAYTWEAVGEKFVELYVRLAAQCGGGVRRETSWRTTTGSSKDFT